MFTQNLDDYKCEVAINFKGCIGLVAGKKVFS